HAQEKAARETERGQETDEAGGARGGAPGGVPRGAGAGGGVNARERPVRLLFVCLGNICRSPTAEGVMRHVVEEAGMQDEIELDSAGTGSWHVGSAPDERATAAARGRGVTLAGAARQVRPRDFEDFDLILAMDRANLRDLRTLADDEADGRIRL